MFLSALAAVRERQRSRARARHSPAAASLLHPDDDGFVSLDFDSFAVVLSPSSQPGSSRGGAPAGCVHGALLADVV
jgi:hypothetical protein